VAAKRGKKAKPTKKRPAPASFAFRAKVERLSIMYVVDVPRAISRAIGVRGYVPIAGVLQGRTPFRASLMPRGGGRHSILLNGEIRSAARIALGDRVAVEIHVDREPRGGPTPEDVADALRDEGVLETFESLAAGKRFHILRWVDQAVREETRAKRVVRVVEVALGEHEKRLDREAARATRQRRDEPVAERTARSKA
jgi:hypothetical protein